MFQYNIILEYYIIPPYYIHDNIVVAIIKNISSFLVIYTDVWLAMVNHL